MPCLLAILAVLAPRILMVFIWLLTDWFSRAYETWLIPLLGFIFLPYTTVAFMGAQLAAGGVTLGWGIILILAFLADISHWGYGGRTSRVYVVRRRKPRP